MKVSFSDFIITVIKLVNLMKSNSTRTCLSFCSSRSLLVIAEAMVAQLHASRGAIQTRSASPNGIEAAAICHGIKISVKRVTSRY